MPLCATEQESLKVGRTLSFVSRPERSVKLDKDWSRICRRLAAENSPEICGANADGKLFFLDLLFGDRTKDDWLRVIMVRLRREDPRR
jgi:hypothetical protein